MPDWLNDFAKFTPEEFEKQVQQVIEKSGINLSEFRTRHRESLSGTDGDYEIDIVARFVALKTSFVVLVECKHHKNSIKREIVQILHDRLISTGSQKGMLFTSSSFQKGAIEYAKIHNIALIKLTNKEPIVYNSANKITIRNARTGIGPYLIGMSKSNEITFTRLALGDPEIILEAMGLIKESLENEKSRIVLNSL
jgi:Holliday junction resolvase-like predicted endonuclease